MDQVKEHRCEVLMVPWPTRYFVECPTCGAVGNPQELRGDAEAVAKRHEKISGFERPGKAND